MSCASVSEAEPAFACPASSAPEPPVSAACAAVWENANEAANSAVNTPMKQSFIAHEACLDLLHFVFKRTIPFDTQLCPTHNWKLNGVKLV